MLKRLIAIFLIWFSAISLVIASTNPPNKQIKLNQLKIHLGEKLYNELKNDPVFVELVQQVYGEKINLKNIIDALSEYNKSLQGSSRFDDYKNGNTNALNAEELRGYKLFNSYGCAACHSGVNFGGTQFKQLGVVKNYIIERKTMIKPADLGLAEVTKNTKDLYVFSVPALRNVAVTYPYYHDGSIKSLNQAIYLMGKYQLGVEIPQKDIADIIAFLNTLTSKSFIKHSSGN